MGTLHGVAGHVARRAFLTAEWRHLVMLNYEVAPAALQPLLPAGVTLDLWEGRALVSVVGFRFCRTRILGVPVPFHRDFDEVNLRFYVRRAVPGRADRRGVVFVRELVPRPAIALVARLAYNEPYRAVPMRSTAPAAPTDAPGRIAYEWRSSRRWQRVAATAIGAPAVPPPGSEAAFVAEHYWGYTRQRDGGTVEYAVAHPPWRVWAAEAPELAADVRGLYGGAFERALAGPPASALVAAGSPVTVSAPRRLAPAAEPHARPTGVGVGAD
ncbi:MAG: YqjF family protein [Gemmatimonadaceae bacterium]